MKTKKLFLTVLVPAFLALAAVFSGCSTIGVFSCPYVISNQYVEIGENDSAHKFAGACFSVYNDSEKTISGICVSFMLYDSEGQNPFVGSNCVVARIEKEIGPAQSADFIVNLDSHITVAPDEPYLIDFMYLKRITYSDGSVWKDPFGMFSVKETYE